MTKEEARKKIERLCDGDQKARDIIRDCLTIAEAEILAQETGGEEDV